MKAVSQPPGLLARVFEDFPEAVSITGPAGEFVRANPAYCRMVGYSEDELRMMTVARVTHPEDLAVQRELVRDMLAGGRQHYRMRKRYLHKNGEVVVGCVRSGPLRARSGSIMGLIGVTDPVFDTTAEAESQRYRSLFEHNFDAVYSLDLQGRFVTGNQGLARITGWGPDELAGQDFMLYIEPEHQELRRRMFERAAAGETVNYDTVARHRDGGLRYTNVTYLPIVVDGRVAGVYAIAKDLTERVSHERELERQNQALEALTREVAALNASLEERVARRTAELETLNRSLQAFSASVSHDLRAPLDTISGFTSALERSIAGVASPRARHYMERIAASVTHMNGLIDALLSLAHASHDPLMATRVDLSALASDVLARLAERDPQRKVAWAVQQRLAVQGDPRLVRQVLENLLGNAWKFTAKAPQPHIEFLAREAAGETVFCVGDNGAGFDMAYADRLFRSFQRLHRADDYPGTGIGLATVHAIVSRHGGRVWAEAAPGQGARFFFTLLRDG